MLAAASGCGGKSSDRQASPGGSAGIDLSAAGTVDAAGTSTSLGGVGEAGFAGSANGANAAGSGGISGSDSGGAGLAGTDGEAGTAGAADAAGAAGTAQGACVNLAGAGDEPWFDLTVVGTHFDADEGGRVRIAVATQTPNRVGIADLPIATGSFTLAMPGVLNAGWYVGVTLYVDRNDNDTCEPDEHVWDWTTRAIKGDMRYDVTPEQLCDSTLGSCRPRQPTQQACWVGSGDTELTKPLACNP